MRVANVKSFESAVLNDAGFKTKSTEPVAAAARLTTKFKVPASSLTVTKLEAKDKVALKLKL
ncbi:hypothetical protein D3C86_1292150 [compost metagenome]